MPACIDLRLPHIDSGPSRLSFLLESVAQDTAELLRSPSIGDTSKVAMYNFCDATFKMKITTPRCLAGVEGA